MRITEKRYCIVDNYYNAVTEETTDLKKIQEIKRQKYPSWTYQIAFRYVKIF
jgi:hypothetical protein